MSQRKVQLAALLFLPRAITAACSIQSEPPELRLPPGVTGDLIHTDGFEQGFGWSYFLWDQCGDTLQGQQLRKAILERFSQCPFSDSSREEFQKNINSISSTFTAQFRRYIDEHGKLPERIDGAKVSCEERRTTSEFLKFTDLLQRYSDGKVGVDAVLNWKCDGRAAPL